MTRVCVCANARVRVLPAPWAGWQQGPPSPSPRIRIRPHSPPPLPAYFSCCFAGLGRGPGGIRPLCQRGFFGGIIRRFLAGGIFLLQPKEDGRKAWHELRETGLEVRAAREKPLRHKAGAGASVPMPVPVLSVPIPAPTPAPQPSPAASRIMEPRYITAAEPARPRGSRSGGPPSAPASR